MMFTTRVRMDRWYALLRRGDSDPTAMVKLMRSTGENGRAPQLQMVMSAPHEILLRCMPEDLDPLNRVAVREAVQFPIPRTV